MTHTPDRSLTYSRIKVEGLARKTFKQPIEEADSMQFTVGIHSSRALGGGQDGLRTIRTGCQIFANDTEVEVTAAQSLE